MFRATHGHLASKNENKRQKNIGRWFEVMTAGTADKVALYWYAEPSVLTHMSWCGAYRHTHACTRTACTPHSHEHMQPRMHATLTCTHAATHARNTHTHTRTHACTHHTTNTHSHAQVLNLHMQVHTLGPDRHIHNQVVPVHGLESCHACVNLCLSNLFSYANWQVGPTRNVVNLTSQHCAMQTIWPVNIVQSDAKSWASDRIITTKCI